MEATSRLLPRATSSMTIMLSSAPAYSPIPSDRLIQVAPASVDFHSPLPFVAAYMTRESEAVMTIWRISASNRKIGAHEAPPSALFRMSPLFVAA